jgi:hypothetical protein
MTTAALSDDLARRLEKLREDGCTVFGPGPLTPGQTTPTPDASPRLPGYHVQIGCGHRFYEGFGSTPDGAVNDVLGKMAGYKPSAPVL